MIYYIDTQNGKNENTGTDPSSPLKSHANLCLKSGDAVLFRRGTVIREDLHMQSGCPDGYIRYGAYGDGHEPIFDASTDLSDPVIWEEAGKNIWLCRNATETEIGNLIYNDAVSGTLRWSRDRLTLEGDWYDNRFGDTKAKRTRGDAQLFVYSRDNPARQYSSVAAASYGKVHRIATCADYVICEDLEFANAGVHAIRGPASHMIIRRCRFRMIGGCVWNAEAKIRLGNAIEFWNRAEDVLVENCRFDEIYDSCVTHQGNSECRPANGIRIRNCVFRRYGMAAFEGRDHMPIGGSFCNNTCMDAGEGFSAMGDLVPRRSEIYPLPMGHHLFFWRIDNPMPESGFEISGNRFGNAPNGAAIYSLISAEAEARLVIKENEYAVSNTLLLAHIGGKDYPPRAYEAYQKQNPFGDGEGFSPNITLHDDLR